MMQPIVEALQDSRHKVIQNATALLYIGTDGRVKKVHIVGSSCWEDLDRLLYDVWEKARYEPATCDNGEAIGVWAKQPISLTPR